MISSDSRLSDIGKRNVNPYVRNLYTRMEKTESANSPFNDPEEIRPHHLRGPRRTNAV